MAMLTQLQYIQAKIILYSFEVDRNRTNRKSIFGQLRGLTYLLNHLCFEERFGGLDYGLFVGLELTIHYVFRNYFLLNFLDGYQVVALLYEMFYH